jgi:esterase/lipase superfamily enzyme
MRREYHNWYSHRLNRNMELLAYGHSGRPVLVFPTSQGRFFEFENNGMIHELAGKIDAGQLQVFAWIVSIRRVGTTAGFIRTTG